MNAQQVSDTKICVQKKTTEAVAKADSYYVELTLSALEDHGTLLDSLIQLTFDSLYIRHLDLRIVAEAH